MNKAVQLFFYSWLEEFENSLGLIPRKYTVGIQKANLIHRDLYPNTTWLFRGSPLGKRTSKNAPVFMVMEKIHANDKFQLIKEQCHTIPQAMILASQFLENYLVLLPQELVMLIQEHNQILEQLEQLENPTGNKDRAEEGEEKNEISSNFGDVSEKGEPELKEKNNNPSKGEGEGEASEDSQDENSEHDSDSDKHSLSSGKGSGKEFSIEELLDLLEKNVQKIQQEWDQISEQEHDYLGRQSFHLPLETSETFEVLDSEYYRLANGKMNDVEIFRFLELIKKNENLMKALKKLGKIRRNSQGSDEQRIFSNENGHFKTNQKTYSTQIQVERLTDETLQILGLGAEHPLVIELLSRGVYKHKRYAKEKIKNGPLYLLMDTSGSTSGFEGELKAIAMGIIIYAIQENRPIRYIPFSGYNEFEEFDLTNQNLEEIFKATSVFYNGGTEPYRPLELAFDGLEDPKNKFKNGSIIIITDAGFDPASPDFIQRAETLKENQDMELFAIILDQSTPGACDWATDYWMISDVKSNFTELSDLVNSIKI